MKAKIEYKGLSPEQGYSRGDLWDVIVTLQTGEKYDIYFSTILNISQTIEQSGATFYCEKNLVVVPNITRAEIELAVSEMEEKSLFKAYLAENINQY